MKAYISKVECEHDGDLRRELDELCEAGATVVDVYEEPHGDKDYYCEITFTVADWERFTETSGCRERDFATIEIP